MKEELAKQVVNSGMFTPLEIVLLLAIGILFTIFLRFVFKTSDKVTTAITNVTNSVENNTKALDRIPDMVHDKIKLALKK